jgi:hypothetical protein
MLKGMTRLLRALALTVLALAALLVAAPPAAAALPAAGVLWSNSKQQPANDFTGQVSMWRTGPSPTVLGKSLWPYNCAVWGTCPIRGDAQARTGIVAVSRGHLRYTAPRFYIEHDLLSWNRAGGPAAPRQQQGAITRKSPTARSTGRPARTSPSSCAADRVYLMT